MVPLLYTPILARPAPVLSGRMTLTMPANYRQYSRNSAAVAANLNMTWRRLDRPLKPKYAGFRDFSANLNQKKLLFAYSK